MLVSTYMRFSYVFMLLGVFLRSEEFWTTELSVT
jgi:hypothetical protein